MFSYRHAFHAGSHADALKHVTLIAALRHLMRKAAPLTLIDTHAGAGLYRLDAQAARTSGEAQRGIAGLQAWADAENLGSNRPAAPVQQAQAAIHNAADHTADALADYLGVVASFNRALPAGQPWRVYPGSPLIMYALMTEPARAAVHDRLKLFELHPTDAQALAAHVAQLQAGRRISAARQDGFDALKALLPPPAAAAGSRRALALIDPSYEIKSDYAKVGAAVQDALRRFASGVYLVWYPIIGRTEAHALPRRLKTLAQQASRAWLNATLHIGAAPEGDGLTASGMFIINPPHTLKAALEQALPQLLRALAGGRGAGRGWAVESGP